ncbi:hypothetical protein [Ktedonosporobacter rubrisoli]|uniref:hypothetical protein n=1 Tax=Ktedonosporobacter rubrisoli TaxID=2509675 RepID=UPI001A90D51E|nr:hypothetical protein [Ktedonosporobacter rubrisoli]
MKTNEATLAASLTSSLAWKDFSNASFKANPFPLYARLRAEAPVLPIMFPRIGRTWLVTRYDDVCYVLKDEERFARIATMR